MSSLLSTRSANRGRCKQNCRHSYSLIKDDKVIATNQKLLSMKDLNAIDYLDKLKPYVDSIKIEGRMKDLNYVSKVVKSYRNKLDGKKISYLNDIFHRNYTIGFLNKETNGDIVYSKGNKNIGFSVGKILSKENGLYKINVKSLSKGSRLRFITSKEDYYTTEYTIYNLNKRVVNTITNQGYIKLDRYDLELNTDFYLIPTEHNQKLSFKPSLPLNLEFNVIDNKLEVKTYFNNKEYYILSNKTLDIGNNIYLNEDMIRKQFSKLEYHPFIIDNIKLNFRQKYFLPLAELNNLRRNLLDEIYKLDEPVYKDNIITKSKRNTIISGKICCVVYNKLQYDVLLNYLPKEDIYLKGDSYYEYNSNKIKVNTNIRSDTFGGLRLANITSTGYYFNVINSDAIKFLEGITKYAYICLSFEASKEDLKDIYNSYLNKYKEVPNIEMLVYGKLKLMTMKYCPIKHVGNCDDCKRHTFYLKDDWSNFKLFHDKCITHILNDKPLHLIDDLEYILKYAKRIVLDFTDQTEEEVKNIIEIYLDALKNNNKYFKELNGTRGLFKRKIQ